ncbi:hypothetical protein [Streptomyces sp. NPDC058297]|uniref:hypothetical protein n=1 Tax=Streptomyces sp. NPDC058297 TaxID=3346433 RepID=UPI0036EEFCE9
MDGNLGAVVKKVIGGLVVSAVVVGGGLWGVLGQSSAQEGHPSPAAFRKWADSAHVAVSRESGTAVFNRNNGDGVSGARQLDMGKGSATIRIRDLDKSPETAFMIEGNTYSLTFACAGTGEFTIHSVGARGMVRDVYCTSGKKEPETVSLNHLQGRNVDGRGGSRWDGRMDLAVSTHGVRGVLSWHADRMFLPS